MRQSQLPALVAMTGADDATIVDALLEGIEANIDGLHSAQVYHLAAEISRYAEPEACAAALEDHLARRLKRLPVGERELVNMADVPDEPDEAIGRFLFACLGSPVVPLRWRTAHAVRRLAMLGEAEMLERTVDCFSRSLEPSFGHPEAPFYHLSAKLWLLIAIARAAWENPTSIEPFKSWLLQIGESEELPHVLLRSFAQMALNGMLEGGIEMTATEQLRIATINEPSKPRRKRPKGAGYSTFEKYGFDHTKGRRFDFDTMDTLPYVYDRAVRSFANLSGSAFLDRAEYWIVDKWGAPQRAYEADALRKSSALWQRRGLSSSRSHGSRPSLESYRAYLEFHAMHCAVGNFLKTESLANEIDQWENFEGWLSRQSLTCAPIWLSDLREPKPLEAQFWSRPTGDKVWLRKREAQDIRAELLLDDPEWLVLASDHWGSDNEVRSTVRIEACLVSPNAATSLRRALEASHSSYDYRLAVGDENEIDEGEFQLRSILHDRNTERELDEHDRFRGELGPVSIELREWVINLLDVIPCKSGLPIWVDRLGQPIIVWKSWSDEGSYDGEHSNFDYRVHGSRLVIRRSALEAIVDSTGMDFAVEITMRREMGDRYGRRTSNHEENEFDRIVLFRKEGQIEATGQRFGNWRSHRKRAGARR